MSKNIVILAASDMSSISCLCVLGDALVSISLGARVRGMRMYYQWLQPHCELCKRSFRTERNNLSN